jgi:hypothetical protein
MSGIITADFFKRIMSLLLKTTASLISEPLETYISLCSALLQPACASPIEMYKWRKVSTSADVFVWVLTSAYNKRRSGLTLQ